VKARLYDLLIGSARLVPGWSRPLFGTDASLQAVLKGRLALRRNRRLAGVRVPAAHADVVRRMDDIGFAELGRPYDASLLRAIAGDFERITSDDAAWKFRYTSSGDIHSADGEAVRERLPDQMVHRDLIDPVRRIPAIIELLDHRTVELIEACYRTHFRLTNVSYWRNYHVPPAISRAREVGYSNYWHHDGHAVDTLKLFIVMSDVTEQDGPFHVLPKEDSRRIVRRSFNRKEMGHGGPEIDALQPFRLIGPAGTSALCNTTLCLHRAGIPAPGHQRDLLQFQFVSHAKRWTAGPS
jgi:hypothetical protein